MVLVFSIDEIIINTPETGSKRAYYVPLVKLLLPELWPFVSFIAPLRSKGWQTRYLGVIVRVCVSVGVRVCEQFNQGEPNAFRYFSNKE